MRATVFVTDRPIRADRSQRKELLGDPDCLNQVMAFLKSERWPVITSDRLPSYRVSLHAWPWLHSDNGFWKAYVTIKLGKVLFVIH